MVHRFRKTYSRSTLFLALAILVACSGSGNSSGPTYVKKDNANPTIVAKIFGKDITIDELEKASPDVFTARQELYQAQKRAVDDLVRQAVLEDLAKKEKKSVDAFVQGEMEKAKKKVSDKEVIAFLKERNVGKPDEVPAQLKDQVRSLIYMQNLVATQTKKTPVEIYLKRPQAPQIDFNLAGQASWGKENAPVTIVEFSDFQCPFCAKGKERVDELKKMYGNKVRIVFKHLPLPMHPDARPAAEASMCVNEQSSDKFWKYHDILFENQQKLSENDLKEYAKKVGADVKAYEDCVKNKKYSAFVDASLEEARKLGVNSTPSFFVNSQPIRGARDVAEFKEIIDEALGK